MNNPVIIFGSGSFSELMTKYIERFTDWEIACYTVDDDYCDKTEQCGKPLVKSSQIAEKYPSSDYDAFITIGYSQLGETRKHAFEFLKERGYAIRNFIHPDSYFYSDSIGEGNIILQNASLGLGTVLGNANLIWESAAITHDCKVGDFCTICAGAVSGGFTELGDNCFIGMNATLRDHISIARGSVISAGLYISQDTKEYEAYLMKANTKPQVFDARKIMRFL